MTQREDIHLSSGFARPMTRLESITAGATVSRFASRTLVVAFVVSITAPLVVQLVYELWTEQTLHALSDFPCPPKRASMRRVSGPITQWRPARRSTWIGSDGETR